VTAEVFDTLTRGDVPQVKTVLASVALALAAYQVVLIVIGYGKVRPAFLESRPAAKAHRASGDVILLLLVLVGVMCAAHYGLGEHAGFHAATGAALLAVLALKVIVLRWWHGASRLLPALGTSVFVLLAATWAGSAGEFL
jgi:Family of unknown function (DUF6529)